MTTTTNMYEREVEKMFIFSLLHYLRLRMRTYIINHVTFGNKFNASGGKDVLVFRFYLARTLDQSADSRAQQYYNKKNFKKISRRAVGEKGSLR